MNRLFHVKNTPKAFLILSRLVLVHTLCIVSVMCATNFALYSKSTTSEPQAQFLYSLKRTSVHMRFGFVAFGFGWLPWSRQFRMEDALITLYLIHRYLCKAYDTYNADTHTHLILLCQYSQKHAPRVCPGLLHQKQHSVISVHSCSDTHL